MRKFFMTCSACGLHGEVGVRDPKHGEKDQEYKQHAFDAVVYWHDKHRPKCGKNRDIWCQGVKK